MTRRSRIRAQYEPDIRRIIIQDPARAPELILEMMADGYEEMSRQDRWHFLKGPFLADAVLILLCAVLLGALIGHLLWH